MKDVLILYLEHNKIVYNDLGNRIVFDRYIYDDTTKTCKKGCINMTLENVIKELDG